MTAPLAGTPTFGAGRAIMIANLANPTPARASVAQSQSIDTTRKVESLFGENQLAVAVGAGEMEVTGKVEYGKLNPRIWSDIMLGVGSSTGSYAEADGEAGTVAGTTPYIITVMNSMTFLTDLGVIDVTTGNRMTRVASAPVAAKSYTVAAGVYTFASGDEGTNKLISYSYTSSTVGETITATNQPQGLTGNFQAVHVMPWGTEQNMVVLNNCLGGSSGLSLKKSGFGSMSLDYTAACDNTGTLGTFSFAEAA